MCKVCIHPDRPAIDSALLGGVPMSVIGRQYDLAKSVVHYHSKHMRSALTKRFKATEPDYGDHLLTELKRLSREAERIKRKAEEKKDLRGALAALRELCRIVELQGKIVGAIRGSELHVTNVKVDMDIDQETADRIVAGYLASRMPGEQPKLIEQSEVSDGGAKSE